MKSIIILFLIFLCGCGAHRSHYGNFLEKDSNVTFETIIDDSVSQIENVYPPAKIRFEMQHSADDSFGSSFVSKMRHHGYAITEVYPDDTKKQADVLQEQPLPENIKVTSLAYVIDQNENNFRVIFYINGNAESLSRLYVLDGNGLHAAGYWMMKKE